MVDLETVAPEVRGLSDAPVRAQSAMTIDVASAEAGDTSDKGGSEEEKVRVGANYVDVDDYVAVASSEPSDDEVEHDAPMLDAVETEFVVTI